jgi:solute carrier family 25 (peroxisomal adenine nucleotide transporter), member 17
MLVTLLAGMTCSIASNPIWLVNTRIALSKEAKVSLVGVCKQIYREEGIGAFFKGMGPNLLMVSNPLINYVIYEQLKGTMKSSSIEQTAVTLFIASSISKSIATFATYPLLTVRVRLQMAAKNQ